MEPVDGMVAKLPPNYILPTHLPSLTPLHLVEHGHNWAMLYKALVRPLLFSLPPERAHALGEWALRTKPLSKLFAPFPLTRDPALSTYVAGIPIASPLGVAAGCDKDCTYLDSLMGLGFGYVVGGTVTLHPRPGNPSPRLLRRPQQQALINALGFPSQGIDAVEANLRKRSAAPLIISVSGLTLNEFVGCYKRASALAQGVELNISSPNTAGLREFHDPGAFRELLERVNLHRKTPLFVKIPPYCDSRGAGERVVPSAHCPRTWS